MKTEMMVCPKAESGDCKKCVDEVTPHNKIHLRSLVCNWQTEECPACVPVEEKKK